MREIKFRVWDIELKKIRIVTVINVSFSGKEIVNVALTDVVQGEYIQDGKKIILMQFTGLHDKKDKNIYEGDIVRYEINQHLICKVIWDENNCRYLLVDKDNYQYRCDDHTVLICEVIGNIYENGDLLK